MAIFNGESIILLTKHILLQLDRFVGQLSLDGLKSYVKKMKSLDDFVSSLSRRIRKPTICIFENKGADQLRGRS